MTDDELVEEVEKVLKRKYLKFNPPGEYQQDRGAAIFTDPRLEGEARNGPLGGSMVGRVHSVRWALFRILEVVKIQDVFHYKVETLRSHKDGETIGWLPGWQVRSA